MELDSLTLLYGALCDVVEAGRGSAPASFLFVEHFRTLVQAALTDGIALPPAFSWPLPSPSYAVLYCLVLDLLRCW